MKAITFILSLFISTTAFGASPAAKAPAESKKVEAAAPVPVTPPLAPPTVEKPVVEEAEEGEKTTLRESPEGWIPNYRFPKKNERDLMSINVGGNLLNPQGSINFLIAKRLTIGLMPFAFKYRFQGVESDHLGGMITVSAYSLDDLKGLWVFAGVGASQAKAAFLDGRAAGTQPALLLTLAVGNRWRWGHFNTGIAAGGMYFDQIHVSAFRYRLSVFYPAVIYDIGFSF